MNTDLQSLLAAFGITLPPLQVEIAGSNYNPSITAPLTERQVALSVIGKDALGKHILDLFILLCKSQGGLSAAPVWLHNRHYDAGKLKLVKVGSGKAVGKDPHVELIFKEV